MTEFFVPRTGEITLADGSKRVVVKGVRNVPDEIANDPAATRYGIKPVHEMTADERAAHGLPQAAPDVDPSIEVKPKATETPAKADPAPAAVQAGPKPVDAVTGAPSLAVKA